MEIEKQVNSKELGEKLKELGVKEESLFYYYRETELLSLCKELDSYQIEKSYPAYTVAELIEILGEDFRWLKKRGHNENTVWLAQARIHPITSKDIKVTAKTPQEALAKLLIYLLENNLIKLK